MLPLQILIRLSQLLIRPMGPLQIFETANTASMAVGKDLQWQIPPVTPLLVKTAKKRRLENIQKCFLFSFYLKPNDSESK